MSKTPFVLFCLILLCMAACNKNNLQFVKGDISRDVAYKLALKEINVSLKEVDIWASKEKLARNTNLEYIELVSPDTETWLFFVDECPQANWGHPCQYIFVDMDGSVSVFVHNMPPDYSSMELVNISAKTGESRATKTSLPISTKSGNVPMLSHHYAIIISGGICAPANYPRYWNDCAEIFVTLKNEYGYNPDNIYVFMADGTNPGVDNSEGVSSPLDFDDDGVDDIDYAATYQNIDNVLDSLSLLLTDDDYLFIYTIDHGGLDETYDESYLCLWNYGKYYASDFADKIKSINTRATHIVMGQCYSGGFIEFFDDSPSICVSCACGKYETSKAMLNGLYDEYVHYWTQSHMSSVSDTNSDGHLSARESHQYAQFRDTQNETPCHYGAGYLSERLTLTGIYQNTYGTLVDGYCIFNNDIYERYSFYTGSHHHEPEFGISRGGVVDINIIAPEILNYSFNWNITENNNYASVFSPNNTCAHMEIGSNAVVGQRVRVKVDANIPEDSYYVAQFINFYITSNYRVTRSGNNVLYIEYDNVDSCSEQVSNTNTDVFEYFIIDSSSNEVMSDTCSKKQKVERNLSKLNNGEYTLIIKEDNEIKANQKLSVYK